MKVLARSRERLGSGKLKVPQFVLHPAVELVRILLPLGMEFHANGRILIKWNTTLRYESLPLVPPLR